MKNGILLSALSAMLYGCIGFFGTTLMDSGFVVSDLLFWRFLVSSLILVPILFFAKGPIEPKGFVLLLFLGAAVHGVGTAAYFEGSKTIGTGLAMVIFFAYPIFVVGLSALINKTPISWPIVGSIALILVGCWLIAFGKEIRLDLAGVGLALLSAFFYANYVFWGKKLGGKNSSIFATFAVCFGSALGFAAYKIGFQSDLMMPQSTTNWVYFGLFALIGTVLPVLLLLEAMRYISANKASIISVLEPVTTLAVGVIVLREEVTEVQLLGAAIILCSAIVIQLDKDEARSQLAKRRQIVYNSG